MIAELRDALLFLLLGVERLLHLEQQLGIGEQIFAHDGLDLLAVELLGAGDLDRLRRVLGQRGERGRPARKPPASMATETTAPAAPNRIARISMMADSPFSAIVR